MKNFFLDLNHIASHIKRFVVNEPKVLIADALQQASGEEKEISCPTCHGSGEKTYQRGKHSSIYKVGICGKCLGEGKIKASKK